MRQVDTRVGTFGRWGQIGTTGQLLLLSGLVNTSAGRSKRLSSRENVATVTEEQVGFLAEFWKFLRVRKKFWLLPILIKMVAFGGPIGMFHGSAVARFIYTHL